MNPEHRDVALAIVNRAFAEQRHHTRCPLYWWAHSAIAGMWADSLAQIATLTVAPPATPR